VPDPALPIVDFDSNRGLRSDFVADRFDASTLAEAKQQFASIERRLAELPFQASQAERSELTILRLAFSHDAAIEARLTPESKAIVEYPLIGVTSGTRRCFPSRRSRAGGQASYRDLYVPSRVMRQVDVI
jgi:hypothetical protein